MPFNARLTSRRRSRWARPCFRFVLPAATLFLVFLGSPLHAAFSHRKILTIDPNQVAGPIDLNNFPVLVSLQDPNLRTTASGGFVTSASGYDMIFRAEDATTCGGASPCRLDHEIERYDGVTGTLVAWVRVPVLQTAANTVIYLYYGDAAVTCPQDNRNGVWDASYREVFHLHETGDHTDSTRNAFTAVTKGTVVQGAAGKIGLADDFQGGTNGLTESRLIVSDGRLTTTTSLTFEAWVNFRSYVAGNFVGFMVKGRECLNFDGWPPNGGDWVGLYKVNTGRFSLGWTWGDGGGPGCRQGNLDDPGPVVNTNQWYYVAGTFDVATKIRTLYVNGNPVVSDNIGACLNADILQYTLLGNDNNVQDYLDGLLDEIRMSTTVRSADWILTTYNNENSPSTFYSVVDDASPPVVTVTCPAAAVDPCLGGSGSCNLRSIGSAANYVAGTVAATNGSTVVTGTGTAWVTAGRGRGDRITIDLVDYTIQVVDSQTQLRLTSPFTGVTGALKAHTIARKFTTLQAWEDCISGAAACPGVSSSNLVADNRSEIGIAYKDGVFTPTVLGNPILDISGSTTNATHRIRLTADPGNRHLGVSGNGVVIDNATNNAGTRAVVVQDQYVTVEWMEIRNGNGAGAHCLDYVPSNSANAAVFRYNLIHNCTGQSIRLAGTSTVFGADIYNNIIYRGAREAVRVDSPLGMGTGSRVRILNNTFLENNATASKTEVSTAETPNPYVLLRNNILVDDTAAPDFSWNGSASPCTVATACDWLNVGSSNNLSGDPAPATGIFHTNVGHSPRGGGIFSATEASLNFVNPNAGSENLHIQAGSAAVDGAADLSPIFYDDIDGVTRATPWDIGADDLSVATAVTLQSFGAHGLGSAVELSWQTGSELNNLGFNLYRSLSAGGPWTRITSSVIPGLGSSPVGASYSYLDTGLSNGTTYYYELEDIETTGKTMLHGPVSATPQPSAASGYTLGGGAGSGTGTGSAGSGSSSGSSSGSGSASVSSSPARITYGNPSAVSLHVLEQDRHHVLLELLTPGFFATPSPDGSVALEVPGFVSFAPPGSPALPTLRTWVEAVSGRGVRLDSVRATDIVAFSSLRPTSAGLPEMAVGQDGTLRASFRSRKESRAFRRPGFVPQEPAQILETGFQGETKKASIEIAPLRWDPSSQRLRLARRMLVRIVFAGVERDEVSFGGSRGHRRPQRPSFASQGVLAWLSTHDPGLYALRFEDVFPSQRRSIPSSQLRLSYQGSPVGFHLEPSSAIFGPGSVLYFLNQGASLDPYGDAVYALEKASGGVEMPTASAAPSGSLAPYSFQHAQWEEKRLYQGGLLEAPDLWMWDGFITSLAKTFSIDHLASSQEPARLAVFLQGASDFEANPDHHVRASVNGVAVGEVTWDGKTPITLSADVSPGILQEGNNTLTLDNVPDIQAAYSLVYLDRFTLDYPRQTLASSGRFDGGFSLSGQAQVSGLGAPTRLLDTTSEPARWLTGATTLSSGSSASGFAFRAEAGRSYLAVTDTALLHPQVRLALANNLKSTRNQADYILIGPRDFLPAAQRLLDLRRSQGLHTMAVAIEDVYDAFGFGEPRPEAIRGFLAFAFHNWTSPAPRYVLLLGDATYDPKNFMGTGVVNRVPPLMVKTSFMWTVSDPTLAAVNGDDSLPDLAIGRLPAASLDEATVMVNKIVAFEKAGRSLLQGENVLVADNPDLAGNFEANAQDIAQTFFAGKPLEEIFLSQQGAATRSAILAAFNGGASLVSYIGHGSTAVWASENVFNSWDVPNLLPQPQEPFLMTLNCLNGYFLPPQFNSLAEAMLKADGKGAIASFSPSGLSLNDAAHLYHKALLQEILSQKHDRIGDALLAAQADYTQTGAFPEALAIYHLIGDPALRIR